MTRPQGMLIRYAAQPYATFAETAGLFGATRPGHRTAEAGALTE